MCWSILISVVFLSNERHKKFQPSPTGSPPTFINIEYGGFPASASVIPIEQKVPDLPETGPEKWSLKQTNGYRSIKKPSSVRVTIQDQPYAMAVWRRPTSQRTANTFHSIRLMQF